MTIVNKPDWKLALGIPVVIYLSCFLITLSSKFKSNTELLSTAIIIDMLIIAPLIYYLVIRKSNVSGFTVLRVLVAGILIAGWILNSGSSMLLHFIQKWIAPLIEACIIGYIAVKFYAARKRAKLTGEDRVDFLRYCRLIMGDITGSQKAGNIISSEIGVLYYAFFGIKVKDIDNKTKFTAYKDNGILLILKTILAIFLIETAAIHFLLNLWSNTAAWIVTALSLYTCLQLFAHIRAIKARPIVIDNDSVRVYNGLAGDAVIQFDNIVSAEYSGAVPTHDNSVKISLLRKLEKHNCIFYLKHPVNVTLVFGIIKSADVIMFYVDNVNDFEAAVKTKLPLNPM